jgi:hypothetical protein
MRQFAPPEHLIVKEMKSYEIGSRVESRGLGQMDTNLSSRNRCDDACDCAAITSLDQKNFCLNHFLRRCYERLEDVDPRNRKFREGRLDLAGMRAFIEECSRRALDISLQTENLNNLERSRLLDILLWAGELFLLLRAPQITLPESTAPVRTLVGARAASAQR